MNAFVIIADIPLIKEMPLLIYVLTNRTKQKRYPSSPKVFSFRSR